MRMTSPERLILENQQEIMKALSLLLAKADETTAEWSISRQISKISIVLHAAKEWPDG
jgi:hypothetical protein